MQVVVKLVKWEGHCFVGTSTAVTNGGWQQSWYIDLANKYMWYHTMSAAHVGGLRGNNPINHYIIIDVFCV
jgi:hypothetical protein